MGFTFGSRVGRITAEGAVATIIELKPKSSVTAIPLDVSGRHAEIMYAFNLLDHAVLTTSYYKFASNWHQSSRTWSIDGIEVRREDFEEHLMVWLRERAAERIPRNTGTVLPMIRQRFS